MNKLNLIFFTAFVSGFSIFINKFGVSISNAYVFTFIKNSIVFMLLFGLILLFNEAGKFRKLKIGHWKTLVTIGFVGGSVPFLLFFRGLQLTTSAKGSFLHKTMFLYVAVLAYFFLKERFNRKFFLASGLLIFGNFLMLKLTWQPFNAGDFMILAATLLWAVENVISKNALKDIPPRILGFSRMFFGSLFILAFLVATGNAEDMLVLSQSQVLGSVVTAVFLLLYVVTWYTGLKYVPVTTATAVLMLGSPITTLMNMAFSGTVLQLQEAFGMAALVTGVVLFVYCVEGYKFKFPSVNFS